MGNTYLLSTAKIEKTKGKILEAKIQLGQMKEENFDMKEEALDYCFSFFINTAKYWEKGTYLQKIRLQSSIFSQKPHHCYPTFGTPEFSLIFQQKRGFASANPPVVAPTRIELVLPH